MVTAKTSAYRIRDSQHEIAYTTEIEPLEVDKDTTIFRVEVAVQLVEDRCLSRSPLPVQQEWGVAMLSY